MSYELQNVEVDFYKYICESCNHPIYSHYKCSKNCPHCGKQCNENTTNNKELVSDIIVYSIDPKNGEIAFWE